MPSKQKAQRALAEGVRQQQSDWIGEKEEKGLKRGETGPGVFQFLNDERDC
jgi:hypothetical protein